MKNVDAVLMKYIQQNKEDLLNNLDIIAVKLHTIGIAKEILKQDLEKKNLEIHMYQYAAYAIDLYILTTNAMPYHQMAMNELKTMGNKSLLFSIVNDTWLDYQEIIDKTKPLIVDTEDTDQEIRFKAIKTLDLSNATEAFFNDELDEETLEGVIELPIKRTASAILAQQNLDMLRLVLSEKFNDQTILDYPTKRSLVSIIYNGNHPGMN